MSKVFNIYIFLKCRALLFPIARISHFTISASLLTEKVRLEADLELLLEAHSFKDSVCETRAIIFSSPKNLLAARNDIRDQILLSNCLIFTLFLNIRVHISN